MTAPTPLELLARIERANAWLSVAAVALGGLVWGASGMLASGVGAAIACANFRGVRWLSLRAVTKVTHRGTPGHATALVSAMTAKLSLLVALIFVALRVCHLNVTPFTLGISVFVFSIFLTGLTSGLQKAEGVL